jgi:hypothetical protein
MGVGVRREVGRKDGVRVWSNRYTLVEDLNFFVNRIERNNWNSKPKITSPGLSHTLATASFTATLLAALLFSFVLL